MTVHRAVHIFAVLLSLRSASPTTSEHVWLVDVTTRSQTDKRTLSDVDLPSELTFHLRRGSETLILNLKRNYDMNPDADFYFVRTLEDGQSVLEKSQNLGKKDVAYYQDKENSAAMTVRCAKTANTQCDRIIKGHIRIGDSLYDLQPAKHSVKTRNVLEAADHLGNLYVLNQQSVRQSDFSAEDKDAGIVNRERIQQEFKSLLHHQRKEMLFPPSDTTKLSFGNVEELYDETVTGKYRRRKENEFYVKVSVVIDPGLWDFYSSLIPIADVKAKTEIVMQEIREAFSHIMNGVNLMYKGIDASTLSIDVILTSFIVFQNKTFPHKKSQLEPYKGYWKINGKYYLYDSNVWDNGGGMKAVPEFDTGILFTRHDIYEPGVKCRIAGLTHNGGVCDPGQRMVIIQAVDFFFTVFTTAHELAHSLGAIHDGDSSTAGSCKADDLFIMSPKFVSLEMTRATRNNWIFSKCSVKDMKDKLKKKTCVKKPGALYNPQEYANSVRKQPGEVYTSHDQCRFIIGPGSVCCEVFHNVTKPADVCHRMRCSDPLTGICLTKYHGVASGTECGPNKWCMYAWCVPKVAATLK